MKNTNTEKKSHSFKFARRHNLRTYHVHTWTRDGAPVEMPYTAKNFGAVLKMFDKVTPFGVYADMDDANYSYLIRKVFAF